MDLLNNLNKQQKEAVMHTEGPLLILAGAGSGKTRVITHRIAYLIREKGVYPSNVLAITFTNKAAREMKDRVETLLGDLSANLWVATFHSTCIRILRRDIEKVGFERSFVIFDTDDQIKLIKVCLKELNINEKNFVPRMVLDIIGRAKDELIEPEEYSKENASDFFGRNISKIYTLYQKKLKQNNALDFDDIIMYTVKLLEQNPPVLSYYQNKFRYIHVDEYQDTNTAQYKLISKLAEGHGNLCVVGDDDQSIYSFRGADIRNILEYEKKFKDCKVIKLEQNYRSSDNIIKASNSVIMKNTRRKKKTLRTENPEGDKVQFYRGNNEHEEAKFAADEVKRLVVEDNRSYKDFAILYRMNAQSRVLEERLIREGIPYKIFGGLKFYDRKEIKDIIAYLRVIMNPSDDIALKRIINVPKRGIGATTVENAEENARNRECSIFTIISSASEISELNRASARLEKFASLINGLRVLKDSVKVSELIQEVIQQSGILSELEIEKTDESASRVENIKEFISAAIDFESGDEDQSLESFLINISLVADIDDYEGERDNIVLMTLHSAKGLEFPVVFMVGMEEGVFPGYKSLGDEEKMEEERRLCYVGMTRAKERLYLLNTQSRTLFGKTTSNKGSDFIEDINADLIENLCKDNSIDSMYYNQSYGSSNKTSYGSSNKTSYGQSNKTSYGSNYNPSFNTGGFMDNSIESYSNNKKSIGEFDFIVGDRVIHKKFGVGTITSIEEENDDYKVEIEFKKVGMKRLMAAYANLVKLV